MQREALRGVRTREGVAAARGHSTKHSTGRRRQIRGQTAAWSPPPAAHSPLRKSTPHYTLLAILHQPKEGGGAGGGGSTPLQGPGGVLAKPRCVNGTPGAEGVDRGRSMHKEALGNFNQALATRDRTGGLGSGLHRDEMAPVEVKDWGCWMQGPCGEASPDPGLTLSTRSLL